MGLQARWLALAVATGIFACDRSSDGKAPPTDLRPAAPAEIDSRMSYDRFREAARSVEIAPLDERPALAERLARAVPPQKLAQLAAATRDPDLLFAYAASAPKPAQAIPLWQLAAAAAPTRAEPLDRLGQALVDAGRAAEAVAAWDRASELAPAQAAYQWAAIRALVAAGKSATAHERASAQASRARASGDADRLLDAAESAALAGDLPLSVRLAGEARDRRPGDGRLVFAYANRLAAAQKFEAAARVWIELLVCGAHNRPWHRHEVAGQIEKLRNEGAISEARLAALLAQPHPCTPVDPSDLAPYLSQLAGQPTPR